MNDHKRPEKSSDRIPLEMLICNKHKVCQEVHVRYHVKNW